MDFLRKLARKINGNPISRNLVLAACAIIVFMCVVNLLLNLFTRHGQVRDVPDFSGMTVEEAVKAGKGASLKIEVNDSLYVPAYPGGVILEQNPSAGARVKSGRHIFVTINSFHQKMVTVPYVTGFSLRQAKNNLEMAGLEIKELIYKSDIATNYVLEERCAGKVVQPGSKLQTEMGSGVTLVVGMGEEGLVAVPKVEAPDLDVLVRGAGDDELVVVADREREHRQFVAVQREEEAQRVLEEDLGMTQRRRPHLHRVVQQ